MNDTKLKIKQIATGIADKLIRVTARAQRGAIWNRLEEAVRGHVIREIHLATVNFCNAKCVFCGQHRFKRPYEVMDLSRSVALMIDATMMGIHSFDFTPPLGDPLLDPHLFDRIRVASVGGKYSITTNAIKAADFHLARKIVEHFHEIRISTAGFDREAYKEAYGVDKGREATDGFTNIMIANIERYYGHAKEPRKILVFLRSGLPLSQMEYFFRLTKQFDWFSVEPTNLYDNWGGSVTQEDMVGVMKMRKPAPKVGVPCRALFDVFVEWDGSVRLCGCRFNGKEHDGLVIGNAFRDTLRKVISAENILSKMREFHFDAGGPPDVCQNCTLYRPMTLGWLKKLAR